MSDEDDDDKWLSASLPLKPPLGPFSSFSFLAHNSPVLTSNAQLRVAQRGAPRHPAAAAGQKEKCVHLGRQVLAYQHLLPIVFRRRRRRRRRKDIKTLMVEGYEVEVFSSESPPDPSSSAFDSSIYIGFTSISLSLGVFLSVIYNK